MYGSVPSRAGCRCDAGTVGWSIPSCYEGEPTLLYYMRGSYERCTYICFDMTETLDPISNDGISKPFVTKKNVSVDSGSGLVRQALLRLNILCLGVRSVCDDWLSVFLTGDRQMLEG